MRTGGALKIGLGMAYWRARLFGFVGALSLCAMAGANAAGETRTLHLHNIHTHEDLTITYRKNGEFDPAALKRLNTFFRDWRKEQEVTMDPQLFDMLWEVHREVKATGPIHVVCGYRSPATNSMLRSRSSGVAQGSLHIQGKAIDFSIPSANVADVRAAALRIQGGGVGYYPTSGIPFVHMDVGNVRHWPRMTRDQLAKVFPNGRTLHVSADGPLSGYEQAQADAERNGGRRVVIASADQPARGNVITSLFTRFRGNADPEETEDASTSRQAAAAARRQATTRPAPAPAPVQTAAAIAPEAASVPLPPSRPAFQIASAEDRPVPAPARPVRTNLASLSPNQIIEARGYWQGLPELPRETVGGAATESISSARRVAGRPIAAADAELTASVGPFVRDRVAPDIALAYAAQADKPSVSAQRPATVVTQQASGTVAAKPGAGVAANVRAVKDAEKLNDPWMRGLVLAPSLQNSMITTTFGVPDFRTLTPLMQKPASAVVMTFSNDPHLGMTSDEFTGSAVVFQATVTFGMKTAALQR